MNEIFNKVRIPDDRTSGTVLFSSTGIAMIYSPENMNVLN